jgi:hypothetical protein
MQVPLHTPVLQSASMSHVEPTSHVLLPFCAEVHCPPQSTPLSSPFWTPSLQVGPVHTWVLPQAPL